MIKTILLPYLVTTKIHFLLSTNLSAISMTQNTSHYYRRAGAELGGTDKNHYFNHYVVVTINKSTISYKVQTVRKAANNVMSLFFHNMIEFMSIYCLAHWDLLLIF